MTRLFLVAALSATLISVSGWAYSFAAAFLFDEGSIRGRLLGMFLGFGMYGVSFAFGYWAGGLK